MTIEFIPEPALDNLLQAHGVSSYHPDGDQRTKLHAYGLACQIEGQARNPGPTWQPGNPSIPDGTVREFIVAVRRRHDGNVYTFSAHYAEKFTDYPDSDDEESERRTGWFDHGRDMSGEYSYVYEAILNEGDEVVGWQPTPEWKE